MTYGGTSWREYDDLGEMAAVLSVMRRVHEMLAHLREVRSPYAASRRRGRLRTGCWRCGSWARSRC